MGARYGLQRATALIRAEWEARGLSAKQAAPPGMDEFQWHKKVKMQGNAFSIDEIGQVADMWDMPHGWPFVELALGRVLDERLGVQRTPPPRPEKKRKKRTPRSAHPSARPGRHGGSGGMSR